MRRGLATFILTISLWMGTIAWSGFVALNTVLDPGRSERVAVTLYEDDAVRNQLIDNIADSLATLVPAGAPISRPQLEQAATVAVESPAVKAVVVDAFVQSHKAFLGEGEAPESINAGAFGEAARAALVSARPELDGQLPPAPELQIQLPTENMPDLGGLRRQLQTIVPVLALLAAAGATLALIVTSNRPAVLRRAGIWAMGVSATIVAFAYVVPWLARALVPSQADVVAALIGALAETTRTPAIAMAAAGLGGVLLSFVWRALPDAAPASSSEPRPDRRGSVITGRPTTAPRMRPIVDGPAPAASSRVGRSQPAPATVRPPASRVTGPYPVATASDPMTTRMAQPRWVEGQGWVIDPTDRGAIPAEARWVPGVGYVVDAGPP